MRTSWYVLFGFIVALSLVVLAYFLAAYGPTAPAPAADGRDATPPPDVPANDSREEPPPANLTRRAAAPWLAPRS